MHKARTRPQARSPLTPLGGGDRYTLTGHRSEPSPTQERVPLLVGGGGRRIRQIAAWHADAVGSPCWVGVHDDGQLAEPSRFGPSFVDKDVESVRAAARARSANLEVQVLVQPVVVTDDAVGAADKIWRPRSPSGTLFRRPLRWSSSHEDLPRSDRGRFRRARCLRIGPACGCG